MRRPEQLTQTQNESVQHYLRSQRKGRNWKGRGTLLLIAAMLVSLIGAPVQAQTSSGSISGEIFDSNHYVPNAQITAHETDRNLSITVKSDGAGHFIFPELPPGTYNISVSASGFRGAVMSWST